jgi:hypothetical protein
MPIPNHALDSEQKLLWRTWQEKRRRADGLADRRMTVLFLAVGLILLACTLYYAFWPKVFFDSDQQQRVAVWEYLSIPIAAKYHVHGRNLNTA